MKEGDYVIVVNNKLKLTFTVTLKENKIKIGDVGKVDYVDRDDKVSVRFDNIRLLCLLDREIRLATKDEIIMWLL